MGVSAAEIRAGAAYVELVLRDKLASQLAAASDKIKKFAGSVHNLGMKAFGGALPGPVAEVMRMAMSPAGAFAGFQAAAKTFADAGAEMFHLAQRTGMTVEQLSALKYAAEASGTTIDAVAGATIKMQKALVAAAQGGAEQTQALALMGLTVQDFAGMDPAQQLMLLAGRLDKIQDPALRAAEALKIFGRGGAEIFPLLAQGREGIWDLANEAQRFGFIMGSPAAEAAEKLHRKFLMVERAIGGITRAIGEAVAAMQGEMLDTTLGILVGIRDWIKANQDAVAGIAKVVAMVVFGGGALVALGGVLSMVATMFTALAGAATFAATVLGAVTSIPGLILVSIGGMAGAVLNVSKGLNAAWQFVYERIMLWGGRIRTALAAIWNAMAGGRMDLAIAVLTTGVSAIGRVIAFTLVEAWSGLKSWFAETFWSIWDSFKLAASDALLWLGNKWINIKEGFIGAMLTVAETLYTAFVKVFAALGEMMENMVTGIMASMPAMMGGISADEADARRENAAARRASTTADAGSMFKDIRAKRAQEARKEKQEDADAAQKRQDAIFDAAQTRRAEAKKAQGEELAPWNAWVREAVAAWAEAVGAAQGVRRVAKNGLPINPAAGFDPDAAALKFGTAGTFSARAAEAMGQGGPVAELVKHARKQAEHAAKMSVTAEGIAQTLGTLTGKSIAQASNAIADGIGKLKNLLVFQ